MLHLFVIPFSKALRGGQVPSQMKDFYLDDDTRTYTPNAEVNEFVLMNKHLMPINDTLRELPLTVSFKAFGFFKGQLVNQMNTVLDVQKAMGAATDSDFDDIKSMFLETNPTLLIITAVLPTAQTHL